MKIGTDGRAAYFPDSVENGDIQGLREDLDKLWHSSEGAIELLQNKHDSKVQSGLFGLVNELDTALRVGFLISDRVLLADYLYERILKTRAPETIDRVLLGALTTPIVDALPLAQCGRVVIIPAPFGWNPNARVIAEEVAEKTTLTPELISMLSMLSITRSCKLHPFTIAESEARFSAILNKEIDHVDELGRVSGDSAYNGILGGLLSERLLGKTEMNFASSVSLKDYASVIAANDEFYPKYLSFITSGAELEKDIGLDQLSKKVDEAIQERNSKVIKSASKAASILGGIGAGAISLAQTVMVVSTPWAIAGGCLGLSSALTALVNSKGKEADSIISVFANLHSRNN